MNWAVGFISATTTTTKTQQPPQAAQRPMKSKPSPLTDMGTSGVGLRRILVSFAYIVSAQNMVPGTMAPSQYERLSKHGV